MSVQDGEAVEMDSYKPLEAMKQTGATAAGKKQQETSFTVKLLIAACIVNFVLVIACIAVLAFFLTRDATTTEVAPAASVGAGAPGPMGPSGPPGPLGPPGEAATEAESGSAEERIPQGPPGKLPTAMKEDRALNTHTGGGGSRSCLGLELGLGSGM